MLFCDSASMFLGERLWKNESSAAGYACKTILPVEAGLQPYARGWSTSHVKQAILSTKQRGEWRRLCLRSPWTLSSSKCARVKKVINFGGQLLEFGRVVVTSSSMPSGRSLQCCLPLELHIFLVFSELLAVCTMQPNKPDYKKMIREKAFSWLRFWKVLIVHVQMWKWRDATTNIPHLNKLLLLLTAHKSIALVFSPTKIQLRLHNMIASVWASDWLLKGPPLSIFLCAPPS